jgi:calcineurin-like phosphoesterase
MPHPYDVAARDVRLAGAIVEVDSKTGRAISIRRICERDEDAEYATDD